MSKMDKRKVAGYGLTLLALVANAINAVLDKKERNEKIVDEVHKTVAKEMAKMNLPSGNTEA